jgi:tRNA threonylcarbamoyladenosine biosynthesis protein TsaE
VRHDCVLEGAITVVAPCGPERADDVHRLTQAAFAAYATLDPPSGAIRETVEVVRGDLGAGGGAIAEIDGVAVGCLRWSVGDDGDLRVRRVAVEPALQRRGLGRALMLWAEREAETRGCAGIATGVRIVLPGNLAFYRSLWYEVVGERRHDGYDRTTWLALRKPLRPMGV